jgi:hypothetical protein
VILHALHPETREREPVVVIGTCVSMSPDHAARESGTNATFPPWANAVVIVGARGYPVVETPEEIEAIDAFSRRKVTP